jgi:hypothetical protein
MDASEAMRSARAEAAAQMAAATEALEAMPGVRAIDLATIEELQRQVESYRARWMQASAENAVLETRLARVEYELRVSISTAVERALEAIKLEG